MERDEDFLHKLDLIFAYIRQILKSQQEMFAFMQSLDERLPMAKTCSPSDAVLPASDWVDAYEVKELLHMGDQTLRRRRLDGTFQSKKVGKKWFYLRSSLQ